MVSLMGELFRINIAPQGVLGLCLHGGAAIRLLLKTGLPVFCSFNTPSDIVGALGAGSLRATG